MNKKNKKTNKKQKKDKNKKANKNQKKNNENTKKIVKSTKENKNSKTPKTKRKFSNQNMYNKCSFQIKLTFYLMCFSIFEAKLNAAKMNIDNKDKTNYTNTETELNITAKSIVIATNENEESVGKYNQSKRNKTQ